MQLLTCGAFVWHVYTTGRWVGVHDVQGAAAMNASTPVDNEASGATQPLPPAQEWQRLTKLQYQSLESFKSIFLHLLSRLPARVASRADAAHVAWRYRVATS